MREKIGAYYGRNEIVRKKNTRIKFNIFRIHAFFTLCSPLIFGSLNIIYIFLLFQDETKIKIKIERSRRKNEWMKENFIPEETAKEIEMMRKIKGFESSNNIDEVIKRILLENCCYNDSYTLENLCEKHKEKMCPYHKFKVNPNCVCYNGMLWKKNRTGAKNVRFFLTWDLKRTNSNVK